MKRLTFPRAGLLALLGALPAWCAAASIGIVTIAEGEASVVREAQRFAVAEGLRVHDEDIVRTGRGIGYRFDRHADVVIRFGHGTPSPDRF